MNQPTALKGYAALIAESIGTTDPAMLALVEDIMRADRSGLDSLSRSQFASEARQAMTDVIGLHITGMLDDYCDAMGLTVPAIVLAV